MTRLVEDELDAALGRQRRLGDQQRGDGGIGDVPGHRVADLGAAAGERADEVAHRVVLAELDEARDGVQLIGELVGLRAQCVGDALVRRQLSLHRREFGAVPHRGDGTDALAARAGRPAVQGENPCPGGDHDVAAVFAGGQELFDGRVEPHRVDATAHGVAADPEQLLRAVVEQRDDTVGVDRDHALTDAVQQRFPMIGQPGDLRDLQTPGVPLDASRQQPGGQHAECGAEPEVDQQSLTRPAEQLPRRRIGLADRDGRQYRAVGGQDRHLSDERVCAVDVEVAGPCPAVHHPAAPEVGRCADARRVRGHPYPAVGREDLDQARARQRDRAVHLGGKHLGGEGSA